MAPSKETLASSHLDPDFEQIIKNAGSPPLPPNADIQLLRKITNGAKKKAREALGGPPPGVTERDIRIPVRDGTEILARVFAPEAEGPAALPILIFFHGGGFCIGNRYDDLESNRAIASRAKVVVVSLEYRLAPEYPFPQAIHDGLDSLHWIANNASQIHPLASPSAGIIVGGTSAGGNIANSVVYLNRDQGSPTAVTGQVLCAAPLVPAPLVSDKYKEDHVSPEQNKAASIPSPELTKLFIAAYKPAMTADFPIPLIHPSGHKDIPKTYLQVCGLDVLRDDGIVYDRILREEAGVATRLDLYPGLPHHFWEFFPQLKTHIEKRTNDTVNGILWLVKDD